jgi:hypothetical protein
MKIGNYITYEPPSGETLHIKNEDYAHFFATIDGASARVSLSESLSLHNERGYPGSHPSWSMGPEGARQVAEFFQVLAEKLEKNAR